jgi:regulator of replication initiation timing
MEDLERENYLLIDKIINDAGSSHLVRLAQLKTVMSNIDDKTPFRGEDTPMFEVIEFKKRARKIYRDLMKIKDEMQKIHRGVEAALELKKIREKLVKISIVSKNNRVKVTARQVAKLADSYLSTVYTYACGITF